MVDKIRLLKSVLYTLGIFTTLGLCAVYPTFAGFVILFGIMALVCGVLYMCLE